MARKLATLGGGCFWCLEAVFQQLRGVESVVSGYTGGKHDNPTYNQVCSGETGHAEVVQVAFDDEVISYKDLLRVFFHIHDPTTLNRQGNDVGTQYRSVVFTHDEEQLAAAEEIKLEVLESDYWGAPLVTEITSLKEFYPAEDYHQDYFNNNPSQPYCLATIPPKLEKLRKSFGKFVR